MTQLNDKVLLRIGEVIQSYKIEKLYIDLYFSDHEVRPGTIKLARNKWLPVKVRLNLLSGGHVIGIKSCSLLEDTPYKTHKASSLAAKRAFMDAGLEK